MPEQIHIDKLVHGGQGISALNDGKRVFVWNALPGETVQIELLKRRSKIAEGVATEIITPSQYRVEPRDDAYLSTSPWQIVDFATENKYKQEILVETMQREHVNIEKFADFVSGDREWHYRNKMEYSFYGDDDGLHLALFNRGSKSKKIIKGSSIAMEVIDATANIMLERLNSMQIHGSTLKTMVIRADQKGNTAVSLFVKDEEFPAIDELPISVQGIVVYYSTPKSPASVMTRKLYSLGNTLLSDNINNTKITYDVNSFFQVNIEVFNLALQKIGQAIGIKSFIDMYSGVGTIGLGLGMETEFLLVESNVDNTECALINARNTNAKVIQATAETALEYITNDRVLIVDPPRAGLHHKVVKRILDVKPLKVVYLSCNPITQARDLAILQEKYKISELTGYNFFPKTPHIESLAILELKNR